MFKLVLEKAEEPEIKLPTSGGSSKKAREFQKIPSGEPGVSGDFWGSQEGCQGPSRPSGPKVSVDTPRTYLGHPVPPGPLLRRQDRDLSTQQSAQTSDRADQAARPCPPLGHIHTSPASSVPMRSEAEGKHTTPGQTEQRKPVLPGERPAVAGEGLQATGMLCWGHIPGSEHVPSG